LGNGPEEPELKAGCLLEKYQTGSTADFELFRPSLGTAVAGYGKLIQPLRLPIIPIRGKA